MSRTPKRGTFRPHVVRLLTDYDPTRGHVHPRPAGLVHRGTGKPFTTQENLLVWSATRAEREAAAAYWRSAHDQATADFRDRRWARDRVDEYRRDPDELAGPIIARMPPKVAARVRAILARVAAEQSPPVDDEDP